uniref:SWIM-type domain-containing protein n=1 Tax=Kalanchoe fedtschenkoi TaxID=63787 RepID=A0A7N0UV65_KALFE
MCDEKLKPYKEKIFNSLNEGISVYKEYARISGYQVRLATTQKVTRSDCIKLQYLFCNRQGLHKFRAFNHLEGDVSCGYKRRFSTRTGCKARLVLRLIRDSSYVVSDFVEEHNHCLTSPEYQQFLKSNRSLNFAQENFIMDCGNIKIGAKKSHKILKEISGGYANVGAQNFVGNSDAQIILDRLKSKQDLCPGFAFDYFVGTDGALQRCFWADSIAKNNFEAFGDCVAFDATYRTNKYNLVFIPFTGVDNHKCCITLGAGLLAKENVESYEWLMESFRKIMSRGPRIWVTDQDPSMKIAIKNIFPNSIHRLCMWHITKKFTEKIGNILCRDKKFLDNLDGIVCNAHYEPDVFESEWARMIEDYKLQDNKWLSDMYEMRANWIPAFFRDIPMGGLLRTTSCSECENSFFNCFFHPGMSLTEFFMAFDSAMDAQRHRKDQMDHETTSSEPIIKTSLHVEKQAAEVYTRTIFYDVQHEIIESCLHCHVCSISGDDESKIYGITNEDSIHLVHHIGSNVAECICKNFQRIGLACRHIFLALKSSGVTEIPDYFISKRWTKKAVHKLDSSSFGDIAETSASRNGSKELWIELNAAAKSVGCHKQKIDELIETLRTFRDKHSGRIVYMSKQDLFESIIGSPRPTQIIVQTPQQSRNKGCGKRLMSERDKIVEK